MKTSTNGTCTTAILALLIAFTGVPLAHQALQPKQSHTPLAATSFFLTQRLKAYRITQEHFHDLHKALSNPLMPEGLHGTFSEQEVQELIKDSIARWEKHNFGPWVFYDRQSQDFIGIGDLIIATQEVSQWSNGNIKVGEVMLNVIINPEFWNKGFGTEIAKEIIIGWFNLSPKNIVAFTNLSNTASCKIMNNLGAARQEFPESNIAFYRITRKRYAELAAQDDSWLVSPKKQIFD